MNVFQELSDKVAALDHVMLKFGDLAGGVEAPACVGEGVVPGLVGAVVGNALVTGISVGTTVSTGE
jgi:hypothetical protein